MNACSSYNPTLLHEIPTYSKLSSEHILSSATARTIEISGACYSTVCSLVSTVIELSESILLFNNELISMETTAVEKETKQSDLQLAISVETARLGPRRNGIL